MLLGFYWVFQDFYRVELELVGFHWLSPSLTGLLLGLTVLDCVFMDLKGDFSGFSVDAFERESPSIVIRHSLERNGRQRLPAKLDDDDDDDDLCGNQKSSDRICFVLSH